MATVCQLASIVLLLTLQMKLTAGENCSISLSTHCECTKDSNRLLHIMCHYEDISDVTSVMTNKQTTPVTIHGLNISYNRLTDLPQQYFQHITSITLLMLSHNSFQSIPAALQYLTGVYELDLSFNQLQKLDFTTFPNLKSLRKLVVKDNKVSSLQAVEFYEIAENLKKLDLSNNNITSIQPETFTAMGNLKVLNLARNNNLKHIKDVSFPGHLEIGNFESDGLEEINTCNFKSLSDLELLDLHDNNLLCSCDLLSLYQWVDRNRKEDELHHIEQPTMWQCTKENGQKVNVTELQSACSDNQDLANCQEVKDTVGDMEKELSQALSTFKLIRVENNEGIEMEWNFINSSLLFGYQVKVTQNNEDVYSSTILHPMTHVYRFSSSEIKSGDFNVCVQVLRNTTAIIKLECRIMTLISLKVVIGVLAGTVFLIPFAIILICIIKKDHTKVQQYNSLVQQENDSKQEKQALYKQQISEVLVSEMDTKEISPTAQCIDQKPAPPTEQQTSSAENNPQATPTAQCIDQKPAPPTEQQTSSAENNPQATPTAQCIDQKPAPPTEQQTSSAEGNLQASSDHVIIAVDDSGTDNPSYIFDENTKSYEATAGGDTDSEISVDQLAAEISCHTKL